MSRRCVCLLSGLALLAVVPALRADPPAAARAARALTARIDHFLGKGWQAARVAPAPRAADAEFLRRIYLDLAGRIPSVAEARQFLEDRGPSRRQRLIDELLDGPRYAVHFSRVLRALWLPETPSSNDSLIFGPGFENWLRNRLAANTGYDRLVSQLLAAPVRVNQPRSYLADAFRGKPTPGAFWVVHEVRPEKLAASTARLFLGVGLECARCHHHPFGGWKKEHFWGLAAFFAGLRGERVEGSLMPAGEEAGVRSLRIPNTPTVVRARYLDGTNPPFRDRVSSRVTLAGWLTSRDNPYFARAAVNRLWAYFFGTGLIEPVDDMVGPDVKASHPELLDELARAFAASGFDLKYLMRALTNSRAYQLTSSGRPAARESASHFARMPVRGLTGEQLYDSIAEATGRHEAVPRFPREVLPRDSPSPRAEFLLRFAGTSEKATESPTTVLQALTLMNGRLVRDATSLGRSETLAAVADAPFLTTPQRVEILYLAALSRPPRAQEMARFCRHLDGRGPAGTPGYQQALGDVFWVLLNSGEFLLNH
jgi:hypothetical protein